MLCALVCFNRVGKKKKKKHLWSYANQSDIYHFEWWSKHELQLQSLHLSLRVNPEVHNIFSLRWHAFLQKKLISTAIATFFNEIVLIYNFLCFSFLQQVNKKKEKKKEKDTSINQERQCLFFSCLENWNVKGKIKDKRMISPSSPIFLKFWLPERP